MGAKERKERREREKEQRRNQILDAARDLLLQEGLSATTVNQIARKSELSVGTIYFYFQSKEEIFAVLQEEGLNILFELINKGLAVKEDPIEKLKIIGLKYKEFTEKYKNYFDIINYFLTSPEFMFPENLKSRIDDHGGATLSLVISSIEDGKSKNIFFVDDVREAAIVYWGLIHGILQFRKLKGTMLKHEDLNKVFNNAVERFIKSLTCS